MLPNDLSVRETSAEEQQKAASMGAAFSHPYDRKDEKDPSGPPVFSDPYGSPSSQFDGRVPARSNPAVERPGNGFRTSLTGRTGKRSVLPQGVRAVFSV